MNFVTGLPESEGYINLLVITNRLRKGVILEGMRTIEAEDVVRVLLRTFYRQYSLPTVIVTDYGPQFTGAL